ncbi:hypothetical protein [Bdellovibrio bacteriovorus]|uniref:hypothetical protein n=1 Tax=Bdellovibrio bacteriovorus TaxID=959 RepID=UPI0035A6CADB
MAKKAAKKEAPAAKAKKAAAKPVAKPQQKAAAKPAAKAAAKPAAKPAAAKPAKPAKEAKAEKPEKKSAPVEAPVKTEKAEKKAKAEPVVEVAEKAPKKEKKAKIDKSGLSEDQVKWHELHEKYKAVKAPAYSISGQFEAKTPLQHKIFGWGYVLSNEYDRLEVLFEDGKRMLISNRKLS